MFGSIYTWANGEHLASSVVFGLTVILLLTNIILNIKKISYFGKTGQTKPDSVSKKSQS